MSIRTRTRVLARLTAFLAVAAAAAIALAAPATAAPTTPAIDWRDAALQLRAAAAGNPDAEAAMDRLLASPLQEQRHDALLPAQVFQIPAFSDTGRMEPASGQLYGSGIALGIDGFRFGFFGGPGRFAPNQDGARLDVMWLNLSTGQSSTAILNQHTDAVVDTTIRTGRAESRQRDRRRRGLRLGVAPLAGSRRRRPQGRLRLRQEHHLVAFAGRGDRELDLRSEEDLGSKPGVFFRASRSHVQKSSRRNAAETHPRNPFTSAKHVGVMAETQTEHASVQVCSRGRLG